MIVFSRKTPRLNNVASTKTPSPPSPVEVESIITEVLQSAYDPSEPPSPVEVESVIDVSETLFSSHRS